MNEASKIQKTAGTLFDLADHADIPYVDQILDQLSKESESGLSRISTENFSALPVARFNTNHVVLECLVSLIGPEVQVVELGSGFTPHYLNLKKMIFNYVEVELPENSALKERIIRSIKPNPENLLFVSGDILDDLTWKQIEKTLDLNKPIIIFSEGVISQYFNSEQKQIIAKHVESLLLNTRGCLIIDDTLKTHPEIHQNPIIAEGMAKVALVSGNSGYSDEKLTFQGEVERWKKLLPETEIVTVDYIKSKPEMDFVTSIFKLIVCTKNLSVKIKDVLGGCTSVVDRIWK